MRRAERWTGKYQSLKKSRAVQKVSASFISYFCVKRFCCINLKSKRLCLSKDSAEALENQTFGELHGNWPLPATHCWGKTVLTKVYWIWWFNFLEHGLSTKPSFNSVLIGYYLVRKAEWEMSCRECFSLSDYAYFYLSNLVSAPPYLLSCWRVPFLLSPLPLEVSCKLLS